MWRTQTYCNKNVEPFLRPCLIKVDLEWFFNKCWCFCKLVWRSRSSLWHFSLPVWCSTCSGAWGRSLCGKGFLQISLLEANLAAGCLLLSHKCIFRCFHHSCPLKIHGILMYCHCHHYWYFKDWDTRNSKCFIIKACSLWRIHDDFINVGLPLPLSKWDKICP